MSVSMARGLLPECSLSSMTQSKPVSPMISIKIGSPVKHCIPSGIWFCASIWRIRFFACIVFFWWFAGLASPRRVEDSGRLWRGVAVVFQVWHAIEK